MCANKKTNFAFRFRFGLPEPATLEDKRDFVTIRLAVSRREEQRFSDTLFENFVNDYRNFTAEDFKIVDSDNRRKLRDLLPVAVFMSQRDDLSWYRLQYTPSWKTANPGQRTSLNTSVILTRSTPEQQLGTTSKKHCPEKCLGQKTISWKREQKTEICLAWSRLTIQKTTDLVVWQKTVSTDILSCLKKDATKPTWATKVDNLHFL